MFDFNMDREKIQIEIFVRKSTSYARFPKTRPSPLASLVKAVIELRMKTNNTAPIPSTNSLPEPKDKGLTKKMKLFVSEYMKDYNPRLAAIRAGYPARAALKQAYSLLSKPSIQTYLEYQEEESAKRNKVTLDYLNTRLKKIVDTPSAKHADQISALQLLARLNGHLKDRQIDNKQVIVLNQNGLPTAQTISVIPPPIDV